LYVVDDLQLFGGSIGGWRVAITTLGNLLPTADLSVKMTATPNPVVVNTDLTYSIAVTNHGPWAATGVKLTNTIPAGAIFVSATPSVGTIATNSGAVVWTIGSLAMNAGATATVVVRPGTLGAAVSSSSVLAAEADPNPINSIAITTNSVISPIADLVVAVVGTPNPVFSSPPTTTSLTPLR
jgi:uncharacterized repeat protein (TIGR01451 family)